MTLRFRLTGQPGSLSEIMDALRKCPRGWIVEIKAPTRSSAQNDLMWSRLDDIAAQVEWYGQKLTSEEWKDVASAGLKRQKVVPGIDGGFVAIGARTSQMTIQEMGELIDFLEFFGAQQNVRWTLDQHTELPGAQKALGGEAGAQGLEGCAPATSQRSKR